MAASELSSRSAGSCTVAQPVSPRTTSDVIKGFTMSSLLLWVGLIENLPALDHADEDHDHRQNEEEVDEPSHRVGGDQAEGPEHREDHCHCPKHVCLSDQRFPDEAGCGSARAVFGPSARVR